MARKVDPSPNSAPKAFSLIGDAKLKRLYAAMLKCRLLDEFLRQFSGGKAKHLSSRGHEAAIVAAAIDLRGEDWILPQHRAAIAAFLRGEPLPAMASRLRDGSPELRIGGEPLHSILPPGKIVPPTESLGAQLNIAAGLALAAQSRQKGQIVMALCEPHERASPQISEALRLAAARRLPLLMLVLRGGPSKPGASSRKPRAIAAEARATGIPVIPVDHADVVAMHRVACESIHKARHNGGPTLIEAAIWPFSAKNPAANDPIGRMEEYLDGKGLFRDRWKQGIVDRLKAEAALLEAHPSLD